MNSNIEIVASELRSWGGVAIVGAGLSVFAGMPPTSGLNALAWHAVDADPDAFNELKLRISEVAISGKALIGDEPARVALAYEVIRKFPKARRIFQEGFFQRNSKRVVRSSPAHEALARLFHDGFVELIASLNWDSLFEAAYERCYGRSPSVDNEIFFKPHGDAAHREKPWILPGEAGQTPLSLMSRLQELASEQPRVLLVIGYSESDEEVVQSLIAPMAARWRVVRIGPSAKGEWSIALPAEVAIPALLGSKLINFCAVTIRS
jgi:hypothetical protein